MNTEYRLNIFNQIKGYYSIFFSGEYELRPTHSSLYMFLINQNNRSNWVEWFKCPYDLAMMGAGINSKTTYYKILDDLVKAKLIEYKKGINNYKAPKIKIINLTVPKNGQVTVPLSGQVTGQLSVPLSVPLTGNKYKLLTDNIKLITDNIEQVLEFLNNKSLSENIYTDFIKSFNSITGKKIRVPDKKFKGQLNARLSEGFTVDEILKAVENCKNDKYHMENPKYLTPEFITRADKLQKFLSSDEIENKSKINDYDPQKLFSD